MNDEISDNHIPEVERNNIVINERFRIEYYRFTYKKIPKITIYHLAMNVTQNFIFPPAKVGVLAQYSPHMIFSQRN